MGMELVVVVVVDPFLSFLMVFETCRQATLQTNYFKNLLEQHGIQADTTEIFQRQENEMK